MRYNKTVAVRFLSRPNRFIAQVELDGKIETDHVKNTGRCKELLLPDSRVILSEADNPARKTRYDLIAVEKAGFGLVNIDGQALGDSPSLLFRRNWPPLASSMRQLRD